MTETKQPEPYDDRFRELGHEIWDKVVIIESLMLAQRHGTPNLSASAKKMISTAETELWGLLQTLFRGGVFPEDMPEIRYDADTDTYIEV